MRIERIHEQSYCRFADMVYWRENGVERENVQTPVPADLKDPNLRIFAAEADGRYVGWISLVYIPKVGRWQRGHVYVDELWVQSGYRRQGIGRALMAKADEWKEELGAVGIRLYVNTENRKARALYEGCGYEESGAAHFMEKNG